ncbi:MAG: hypothetical protein HY204_05090 [Nitrospirae bacterium]|nr:hypothetical protein [Nitrospirota bacterium]
MTSASLLVVFCLFFIVSARTLARRDGVFFAFYAVLFVYTFFTQVAWIAYPEAFGTLVPGAALISDSTLQAYQAFVTASFVGLFFVLWRGTHGRVALRTYQEPSDPWRFACFILLVLLYDAILVGILVQNYETLSYETPDALKGQTLFARPYNLFGAVFLALYATAARAKVGSFPRRACQFLMALTGGIFLVISVRAGSRTGIASTMIGVVCFEALLAGTARRLLSARLLIGAIGIFLLLTAVATFRVEVEGPMSLSSLRGRLLSDPGWFVTNRLNIQALVFGDYAGPSVVLLSSMADGVVIPGDAVPALLFGCLPFGGFSGYPSLGYIVSRIVDTSYTETWQGFGYYILVEGYNVMGWFGILYNAVVIGCALRVSRRFWNTPDRLYRAFVGALFAMQALLIVRGQSSEIIRSWYLVILPGLVLLWLGNGLRADWPRRQRGGDLTVTGTLVATSAGRTNLATQPAAAESRISPKRAFGFEKT